MLASTNPGELALTMPLELIIRWSTEKVNIRYDQSADVGVR
jgi:hypothetical protein